MTLKAIGIWVGLNWPWIFVYLLLVGISFLYDVTPTPVSVFQVDFTDG